MLLDTVWARMLGLALVPNYIDVETSLLEVYNEKGYPKICKEK